MFKVKKVVSVLVVMVMVLTIFSTNAFAKSSANFNWTSTNKDHPKTYTLDVGPSQAAMARITSNSSSTQGVWFQMAWKAPHSLYKTIGQSYYVSPGETRWTDVTYSPIVYAAPLWGVWIQNPGLNQIASGTGYVTIVWTDED